MSNKMSEKKSEEVVFEVCFKVTNRDYKITLSTKRAWIVGIALIAIRLITQYWEKIT